MLCVWCGLKVRTSSLSQTLFLFFFSVGKNILKKYLQKFADINYLRIFVV